MIGTLPLVEVGTLGVDVSTSWEGIVIGPSIAVGPLEVGVVTMVGLLGDVDGVTETLSAVSGYGSIGRISPDGPAATRVGVAEDDPTAGPYGSIGIALPDGPATKAHVGRVDADGGAGSVTASELELEARGNAALMPAVGAFARCGATIQRPAA